MTAAPDSPDMQAADGRERRRASRTPLTTFCPAEFAMKGVRYECLMTNLSENGAGFQNEKFDRDIVLRTGEVLQFEVRTPYGLSLCTGRIAWTGMTDGRLNWGVAFVKLSSNPADPLRSLMNSVF